ncbi:YdcF family protein [Actinomyces vulturis]|uniref:YdcF family protein n=1 Tax=Actinomyces vulturis TaxID=1857645 RepID=UPI0008322596|nr:YdcF family protein [Actinomyces vulturis]
MSEDKVVLIAFVIFQLMILGGIISILIERRTIFAGISFGFILLGIGNSAFLASVYYQQELFNSPSMMVIIIVLAIIAVVLFGLFPIVAYFFVLINGIRVIRREGLSLSHALAAGACVGLLVLWLISSIMSAFFSHAPAWNYLSGYVNIVLSYFAVIAGAYLITHLINTIHIRQPHADYVVVLGAGLINDAVTPLLASRIRKGVEIAEKSGGATIVMSGGQGPDEGIPEGKAMANYAMKKLNVPRSSLIIEDRSETTEQNLLYSKELITKDWATYEGAVSRTPHVALVTSSYHILRALMLARQQHIKCVGYGSPTKMYFAVNAFIREYIAYLVMTKKVHIAVLSIITFLAVVFITLATYSGRAIPDTRLFV